jgi:Cytochrome P460
MKAIKPLPILSVAAIAAVSLTVAVRAGGDKVAFPADYAKGVLYTTVDRADNKQFRELYAPQAAIDAVKAGKPIPSGTVLTMVNFKATLGADGNPEKDANGRFIKTDEIAGIAVMEKRSGWGAEYGDDVRNGEWEYQAFKADKTVNDKANLKGCFTCHKPLDKQDFVFSFDKMKTAK